MQKSLKTIINGEIKIRVAGNRKKELMAVITHELEKIHNSYERLQYQTLVPCNCETCKNLPIPYSYSLDKLNKRLSDRRYQIECENSYEMVDVRRLIDDVMFQAIKADAEFNPQVAQLQSELEQERNESLTHRLRDSEEEQKQIVNSQSAIEFEKEIFISYAWGGESEQFVNKLDETFQAKGIKIIRDKRDLGYKGLIKAFMERIGRGKCAIAVISDKYLKSLNCMFELLQIAKNGELSKRIFPIVLADAQIYKPAARLQYIKYWEEEIKEFDEEMKGVSAANLKGFREEIDQYTEIRSRIAELTNLLKDMNTLTPDIHSKSGFEELLNAIAHRLDE
ncbi:toll/interleukin-1 receptor domain-containing protein [Nostoc sp. JL31]|uniref:toll/interleukin-1 receptor domain-containing protein n=1 Tax=Nostoc sp. JL31 TaxID=2815395 RepID=UPI0025D401AE|nr:toll/interleukin-1 receptor domain-containing protein [Nostoc sp. JL31]